jgi:hypothetical protein
VTHARTHARAHTQTRPPAHPLSLSPHPSSFSLLPSFHPFPFPPSILSLPRSLPLHLSLLPHAAAVGIKCYGALPSLFTHAYAHSCKPPSPPQRAAELRRRHKAQPAAFTAATTQPRRRRCRHVQSSAAGLGARRSTCITRARVCRICNHARSHAHAYMRLCNGVVAALLPCAAAAAATAARLQAVRWAAAASAAAASAAGCCGGAAGGGGC